LVRYPQDRALIEMAPDDKQTDGKTAYESTWDAHGRMPGEVRGAVVAVHLEGHPMMLRGRHTGRGQGMCGHRHRGHDEDIEVFKDLVVLLAQDPPQVLGLCQHRTARRLSQQGPCDQGNFGIQWKKIRAGAESAAKGPRKLRVVVT
jgi:hypothetical protein